MAETVPPGNLNPDEAVISRAVAVFMLVVLAVASIPLLVCMPLTSDTVLYDLQAGKLLSGGTLYRDILEPNLPGIVWVHIAIRGLVGWSTLAMQSANLVIVASALTLLSWAVSSRSQFGWTFLLTSCLFFFSRNEWCHGQRDSWMLLPVALAILLRVGRGDSSRRCRLIGPVVEGFLWGVAFWIKPHIAVSVVAINGFHLITAINPREEFRRTAGVLAGGLLAGMPGIFWLVQSGTWPHFWEMQTEWNPEYLEIGRERKSWGRLWMMARRLHPWWAVHVFAIPVSLIQIKRMIHARSGHPIEAASRPPDRGSSRSVTIAVLYLSWFGQALLLQHPMDYIQVPPVILGIAALSAYPWRLPTLVRRCGVAIFLLLGLIVSPQLRPPRINLWLDCVTKGTSMQRMAVLSHGRFPEWKHFEEVIGYLSRQNLQSGELTCYNVHCIHAYPALGLMPSTRYVGISSLLELFPSHRDEILSTVQHCGHRFLLADVSESEAVPGAFPWNHDVAFESGPFRVYRMHPDQW